MFPRLTITFVLIFIFVIATYNESAKKYFYLISIFNLKRVLKNSYTKWDHNIKIILDLHVPDIRGPI